MNAPAYPSLLRRAIRAVAIPGLLAATTAWAQAPAWYLLSRDEGCVPIQGLARHERLPGMPASPEEFAGLLRERGLPVEVGPVPGLPPELADDYVMVKYGAAKGPIFVRAERCRQIDAGRR